MEFEFVEFFPVRIKGDKKFRGTVHIRLCHLGMNIRGVVVRKIGSKIDYRMPSKRAVSEETNEFVFYPIIEFTDLKFLGKLIRFFNEIVTPKIIEEINKFRDPVWDEEEIAKKEKLLISCKNAKKKSSTT
jgi:hypothetical protein